jgi:hypothetical protein
MTRELTVPYTRLAEEERPTPATWEAFIREHLVDRWLTGYAVMTPWTADVLEVGHGALTYLFDSTPTLTGAAEGDDRVVAVWGHSVAVDGPRDRSRQAGLIPVPSSWSERGRDRGHFVAHAAGGGMDMNFFPQAQGLNRGTSERGRIWRAMERETVARAGTPLFVRPLYDGPGWTPTLIDYGVLVEGRLWWERFENRD